MKIRGFNVYARGSEPAEGRASGRKVRNPREKALQLYPSDFSPDL
jgi:hypothetical protein